MATICRLKLLTYVAHQVAVGYEETLAIQVSFRHQSLGGDLDLYSALRESFDSPTVQLAELLQQAVRNRLDLA